MDFVAFQNGRSSANKGPYWGTAGAVAFRKLVGFVPPILTFLESIPNLMELPNTIMQARLDNPARVYAIVTLVTGLLLGVASVLFSSVWVLAGLATIAFFCASIKRPEIGLLGYLILTSTIVDNSRLPKMPIGIGSLLITDIILVVLLGLILVRLLIEPGFGFIHTPLDLPLLAFWVIAMIATFLAITQSSLTINESLGEVRSVAGYLTFFIVTNLVREERQLRTLLRGTLFLAILVASAMIAQFLLGSYIQILPGRVETLGTEGADFMGVTRIIPPGESLVFTAFLVTTVTLAIDKLSLRNVWAILVWGLTGLGVLLTFKRNLWISVVLALFLLVILSRWKVRLRLLGWILVVASMVAIVSLPMLSQPYSEMSALTAASFDRLASLAKPQTFEDPNSSLRWRDFEYQYAWPQITSHPLLGLGLGAKYRPLVFGRDMPGSELPRFIHNGHLHIIVKTGVLAYLGFFLFSFIALARGFKLWRRIPDRQYQAVLFGFTLAYLGILIGSIVSAMIVKSAWISIIGIMLGTNEVILRMASNRVSNGLSETIQFTT